jgi:parvulin-like peptidyl-prolyl isomerase
MRTCIVILIAGIMVFSGDVMGMGKSDGSKEQVESKLSKESASPVKVEAKDTCSVSKPCASTDKGACASSEAAGQKACSTTASKACPTTASKGAAKKSCCGTCGGDKAAKEKSGVAKTAAKKGCCGTCGGGKAAKGKSSVAKAATSTCSTENGVHKCATDTKVAAKTQEKKAESIVKNEDVDELIGELVVTVNGFEIMQAKIDAKIKPQVDSEISRMQRMGRPATEEMIQGMKQQMSQQAVGIMVIEQLMKEEAKAKKIKVTAEEVQGEIDGIMKERSLTQEQFDGMLTQYGMTIDDLKGQITMGLTADRLMAVEAEAAGESISVSDEQAKSFYDGNAAKFSSPEQVRASHILLKTEGLDDAAKAEVKVKVDALLKEARNGGDFAAMAKANSEDPGSKDKGGEYVFPRGQMVPEFEEAAFSLEVGQVSDAVETQYGYHIIKLSEKMPAETKSFESVKDGIKNQLEGESKRKFGQQYIEKLKSEATIIWAEGKEPKLMPGMGGMPPR